jgi:hypothetical protein
MLSAVGTTQSEAGVSPPAVSERVRITSPLTTHVQSENESHPNNDCREHSDRESPTPRTTQMCPGRKLYFRFPGYASRIKLRSENGKYNNPAVAANAAPKPIFSASKNGATAHNSSSARIPGYNR